MFTLTGLLTLNYFCMCTKIKDLKAIAERIKKSEGVTYGIIADVRVLNDIRRKNGKKLTLPEEFYALAHEVNGIRSDSAELYALHAKGKSGYFTDVVKSNKKAASAERIVLGETEFDYLAYLPEKQRYELQDRVSGSSVAVFSTLADALVYLFGV